MKKISKLVHFTQISPWMKKNVFLFERKMVELVHLLIFELKPRAYLWQTGSIGSPRQRQATEGKIGSLC